MALARAVSMPWLKLTLRTAKEQAERLADALQELGAISVTLEDAANEQLIETRWDQTPLWREVRLSALFSADADVAALLAQLADSGLAPLAPPATEVLADEDWARVWMTRYQPIEVGRNLWICPSWCAPPVPSAVNVVLDPGLAFGTGTHATTALCLAWLAEQDIGGRTLIDYGCGSGILAVAALKLGAAHAFATDLDPQALAVARENALRNGVADRLTVCAPEELPPAVTADLVVANILAGALVELAPRLTGLTRPGGQLALSGILQGQDDALAAAYAPAFALQRRTREEWVLLTGRRR